MALTGENAPQDCGPIAATPRIEPAFGAKQNSRAAKRLGETRLAALLVNTTQ
jgi:hypothetical protein